ncbi:MAG: hypothetical protein UV74_C0001G0004 [Candidatus Woesebacteria bacterium GW2011_GWB1_43_14]|uniref:Uncharacterized protein n=1 Tax=Candidatus Woesebacteria bacterium GW2011_GWB1_43_14 TaxID=1618578 RepID=A0A0G1DMM1_9BACT|nr:MAG: hypothetical protein UV51_C0011G0003 [Candidatus Woesebacteria bacterium GW2011_GWC1_42_9]KKS98894.1 MAG: hypothetical protein UV74_C0001G0004 [Candidatus Woesebacteria bacterium GW2011_GWB1_43_14]
MTDKQPEDQKVVHPLERKDLPEPKGLGKEDAAKVALAGVMTLGAASGGNAENAYIHGQRPEQTGQVDPTPTEIPQGEAVPASEVEITPITDETERENIINQMVANAGLQANFDANGSYLGTSPFELTIPHEEVNILDIDGNIMVYYSDANGEKVFYRGENGNWNQLFQSSYTDESGVAYITWNSFDLTSFELMPVAWVQYDQSGAWDGNMYIYEASTGEILTITIPNPEDEDPSQGAARLLGKRAGGESLEASNLAAIGPNGEYTGTTNENSIDINVPVQFADIGANGHPQTIIVNDERYEISQTRVEILVNPDRHVDVATTMTGVNGVVAGYLGERTVSNVNLNGIELNHQITDQVTLHDYLVVTQFNNQPLKFILTIPNIDYNQVSVGGTSYSSMPFVEIQNRLQPGEFLSFITLYITDVDNARNTLQTRLGDQSDLMRASLLEVALSTTPGQTQGMEEISTNPNPDHLYHAIASINIVFFR